MFTEFRSHKSRIFLMNCVLYRLMFQGRGFSRLHPSIWHHTWFFAKCHRTKEIPLMSCLKARGRVIAKKMSFFLRHNAPEGSFSKIDGSIEISTIQKHLGYSKEEILLATHPAFDHDSECLRKRRFIIIESYLPAGTKETRIAALGGHSL